MTFILESIVSAFISKIISDKIDISRSVIKKTIRNYKVDEYNIQAQIYQVIINALNEVTNNAYKEKQDKIYDDAEKILRFWHERYSDDEKQLGNITNILDTKLREKYNKFIKVLYCEIQKNDSLYRIVILDIQQKQISEIELIKKDLDVLTRMVTEDGKINCKIIKNRTSEYADKWFENMFLNDFEQRDENAGANIKLKDMYLKAYLPHYTWKNNKTKSLDLDKLLEEYICNHEKNKMLLILGQPGVGKSTLITWIINNLVENKERVLVYQFASDLKDIEWNNVDYLVSEILKKLALSYEELDDRTLIIDGFDEIDISNKRNEILNHLYRKIVKENGISCFTLIVTCRANYIHSFDDIQCNYITLEPWDKQQIQGFCETYGKRIGKKISENTMKNILENKDVLGIPLILYMVLALNISIEKEGNIVEIYDRIFSLDKGGIYDRCIGNKSFGNNHRISKIKEQIHEISREISIWMFENEPEKAAIPNKEYARICENIMQKDKNHKQDFLIGNYFKLVRHCEGSISSSLYFIHRSIYEYFVAETIYSTIEEFMIELTEENQKKVMAKITVLLKQGKITNTINEYLQYKILKFYRAYYHENNDKFYIWWENAIEKLMKNGMFYYSGQNISCYDGIIDKEILCFENLLKILKIILKTSQKNYVFENADIRLVGKYIRLTIANYTSKENYENKLLDLSKVSLKGIYLSWSDLRLLNLENSNLKDAYLENTNMNNVNLTKANLEGTHLHGACLEAAKLIGACLEGADFSSANLTGAKLIGVKFENANFNHANIVGTDFSKAI